MPPLAGPLDANVFQTAFPFLTDPAAVYDIPIVPLPDYLAPFKDPVFGRQVVRISGDPLAPGVFRDTGGAFTWSKDCGPHYTRDCPWSRDGAYIHLENVGTASGVLYGGVPSHLLLDGVTYQPARGYPADFSQGDHKWMPSLAYPHAMINIPTNALGTIELFDVIADQRLMSMPLPFATGGLGPDKGTTTRDGRYCVVVNAKSSSSVTQFCVIDLVAQRAGAAVTCRPATVGLPTTTGFSNGIGNVAISPNGNYVICSYNGDFQQVYSVNKATLACTLMTYSTVLPAAGGKSSGGTNGTPASGWIYPTSHFDVGLDADGSEIVVGIEAGGMHGVQDFNHGAFDATGGTNQWMGTIVKVALATGAYTALVSPGTSETNPTDSPGHHVSMQMFDNPGHAVWSSYINKGLRFQGEIGTLALDGSGACERWCHAHSATSGCYRCEEHPVPHYNGRRIMFRSNWLRKAVNVGGSQLIRQAYVVSAPIAP